MMTTTQMFAVSGRNKKAKKEGYEKLASTHVTSTTATIAPVTAASKRGSISSTTASTASKDLASDLIKLVEDEFTFVDEDGDEEPNCVICIGSTGAGKSATISRCTRRPVSSGNGRDRVTVRCAKYDMRPDAREDMGKAGFGSSVLDLTWVDTVGWDDADLVDDHTFKDILRFIGDNQLLRVKAIIWNILPNVRKDALLTKQARLIDLFKPKEIWSNVVIVCKQSRNPEDDSQGALAAARQFCPKAEPPVLGFTFIDDASLTANQRKRFAKASSLREDFLVKNDDEVRRSVFEVIAGLPEPIQVVFKNQMCLDCGLTGDVRLMSTFCHMEKVDVHPGSIVQYHPKRTERYHDSATVLREHPGGLYRPCYSLDFFLCKMGGERYLCCGALSGQPGCKTIRSCCKKEYVDGDDPVTGCRERFQCCKVAVDTKVQGCKSKFDCCDGKVKSKGCRELCKKCDRPWGTLADECYEKDHNIVSFNDKKAIMASLNMLDKPDGKQSKRHKSKKRTKDVNLIEL